MTPEEYIKEKWGEEWLTNEWQAGDVISALEEYAALQPKGEKDKKK